MNEFDFSTKVENLQKYGIYEKQITPKWTLLLYFRQSTTKIFLSADFVRFFYFFK